MTTITQLKSNTLITKITKTTWYKLNQLILLLVFQCILISCGGSHDSKNTSPSISGEPIKLIKIGSTYSFTPTAYDAEGDKLNYRIDNKPSWATFNTYTGTLTGSPAEIGEYKNITIYVNDGKLDASLTPFNVSVIADNKAPTITGTPTTSVFLGSDYIFTPISSDLNNDKLIYRIENIPSWATFNNETGVLSGTPDEVGHYQNIIIYVSDGQMEVGLEPFSISVVIENKAPMISGAPALSAFLGNDYTFSPITSDPNNDKLDYRIENKPSWAIFNNQTGLLSGTPDKVGKYQNIIIYVNDGQLETSLTPFNISVTSNASTSDITLDSNYPGATPFISFLQLHGESLLNLTAVTYTIKPKITSTSKAVTVTYKLATLKTRNYFDTINKKLTIPVFGLYSNLINQVALTFTFEDSSSQTISTLVSTDMYTDPNEIYDQPVFVKKRKFEEKLGFDFIAIKSSLGTPIIIDTDGEIRWVAKGIDQSTSSIFINNKFIIGKPKSADFQLLGLDGSILQVPTIGSIYTKFHHNIDPGKTGFLAHFDSNTDIGSIVSELTENGEVIKEWNFANILTDYMTSQGDDPSTFVRRGLDWFHSNAATYDPRDNSIIVSSRENFIIKIDYDSGKIIWIFGDPTKYWYTFPSLKLKALKLKSGIYPIGQHATSITNDGLLMIFNDGGPSFNQPMGAPTGESRSYSAVSAYQINNLLLTSNESWRFDYNRSIASDICSSAYEAADGSLLVTYTVADKRTKSRLVGLNRFHDVIFDFEYPASGCNTAWNATMINLDKMIF